MLKDIFTIEKFIGELLFLIDNQIMIEKVSETKFLFDIEMAKKSMLFLTELKKQEICNCSLFNTLMFAKKLQTILFYKFNLEHMAFLSDRIKIFCYNSIIAFDKSYKELFELFNNLCDAGNDFCLIIKSYLENNSNEDFYNKQINFLKEKL